MISRKEKYGPTSRVKLHSCGTRGREGTQACRFTCSEALGAACTSGGLFPLDLAAISIELGNHLSPQTKLAQYTRFPNRSVSIIDSGSWGSRNDSM